jgi:UDP-GlcNAc:undecaprenyl-phosphate/decaprenyl-phosphate GlcNAc-1-phosphate transferase
MSVTAYLVYSMSVSLLAGFMLLKARDSLEIVARERNDLSATQCSHSGDPLRFGGVAILVGLAFVIGLRLADVGVTVGSLLMVSMLPIFIAGLSEDLGYHVSPLGRFGAAICSALAASALLGIWVPRADIPVLDFVMAHPFVAIAMTVVFSAGFCHAMNLIDGMNGLAATVIITSSIGCAQVATLAGQGDVALYALIVTAATFGFLALNWPVARVFLGDAGAYGLGQLIVWLLVVLAWRSEDVAIPALMLIMFWPIADVVHTMARRFVERVSILQPDRMHLHQKVRRMLDIVWFGYRGRRWSNPLTTLILLPFIAVPVVFGVLLWDEPSVAWLVLGTMFVAFSAAHPLTTYIARKYRT